MKHFLLIIIVFVLTTYTMSCKKSTDPSPSAAYLTSANILVKTLAGSGAAGSADGMGTNAQFNHPGGMAVDASGNVFVSDRYNHTIRKITPAGEVSTFSGSVGVQGSTDGPVASASFYSPSGLAFDKEGNLYVVDQGNQLIRKISAAGIVSTLAGSLGVAGFADGMGTSAQFKYPTGIVIDANGNLYIGDSNNNRIRKIDGSGNVTTVAGSSSAGYADGNASDAMFNTPAGLTIDPAGNLYVVDLLNYKVRKISTSGIVTTLAGSSKGYQNAMGTNAKFGLMFGIVIDAMGTLYVADQTNNMIRRVTALGEVSTLAGNGTFGSTNSIGPQATFSNPADLVLGHNSHIYVADYLGNTIRELQILP